MEKLIKITVFGPKWANFNSIGAKMGANKIFWEKAKMSLPYAYFASTLCKKPEQTYGRIQRSRTNGQTDGQTDKSEFVGPNSAPLLFPFNVQRGYLHQTKESLNLEDL